MNRKIDKLVDALRASKLDLTAEEVADWLLYTAHQRRPVEAHGRSAEPVTHERSQKATPAYFPDKPDSPPEAAPRPPVNEKKTDLYYPGQQVGQPATDKRGLPFRTPSGYGLPHAREFMRALRPLRRRIPAPGRLELDEEATAQQVADIDIWLPVMKPELVRWLDVMLVVDSAPSMAPWRQTGTEFRRMLEQQGTFRDVRVWRLQTSGTGHGVSLYAEKGASRRHFKELINPARPRLILVLTDCVSPAWTGNKLIGWLDTWGREHPVAIVQVLPQRLWAQTRLRMARLARVVGRGPATPNCRLLQLQDSHFWLNESRKGSSPVPLVCLDPELVSRWAASVAGSPVVLPGFAFRVRSIAPQSPQTESELNKRLLSFMSVASPTALKLACLMAAAPLRLPVMRLVQRALLPESRQEHLAEFLLSGLIRRVSPEERPEDQDRITYDFINDAVRDKLLDAGLVTDAVRVQEVVSRFIADNYGVGVDFLGLIADPENVGKLHIPEDQVGFAKITAKVLKRLGRRYAEVARLLEGGGHEAAFQGGSRGSLPESLGRLARLRSLNLSRNRLRVVPEHVGRLSHLETLDLSENQLTDIPGALTRLGNLKNLNLRGNPLNPELAAAYEDGLEAVIRYLRAKAEAQIVLNEGKLILIGEGEVGKSCLLEAMRGDPWEEGRPTTHGIEIGPLKVTDPETGIEITLNAWDFGGQRVYRPIYQLFFSAPAVYLVVWKPREGPQQGFVREWIKLVKHREPEAKVLVVATHGGPKAHQPDIDRHEIWDLFGRDMVLDFFIVDSKPDAETGERAGIAELKEAVGRVASSLPEVGRAVPRRWEEARQALKETSAAYLPLEEVLKLCRERKMEDDEARDFVRVSHRLGHLINYEHDPALRDIVVLKPDWLATAISIVFDDKQTREAHGLVAFSRLSHLWNDPARPEESRYPPVLHPLFLRLMERFDLSYKVSIPSEPTDAIGFWQRVGILFKSAKEADRVLSKVNYTSLIAQLVPNVRPDLSRVWPASAAPGDEEQTQICRIVETKSGQSASAEGLFFQLIVRLHKYSLGRFNYAEGIHWQRGLVVEDDYGARALLEHTGNDVRITVRSPYPERFLAALTYEVKWLVENFWAGLRCDVTVPCLNVPCQGLFDVSRLINNKRRGRPEQPCPVCNEWLSIELLLHNAPAARPSPLEDMLVNFADVLKTLNELRGQQDEIMGRFDRLDARGRELVSKVDAAYTGLIRTMLDEAKEGPRLFSLAPAEHGSLDRPGWVSAKFRITLWCEHSRLPLPTLNGKGDNRGVYELTLPREWVVKAAPMLKRLMSVLSLVLPVASSATKFMQDEASYKGIEEQLDLGQKSLDPVLKGGEKAGGWPPYADDSPDLEHGEALRTQGSLLRQLHAWLKEKDPSFGGLVRVQNKRQEFLWVHPQFEKEY